MEFKHTTMATPSPNNPTTPSSNNAGAHQQHQSQSQHITTMSSMQGKWEAVGKYSGEAGGGGEGSHSAAVKVNVSKASRGRLRLLPGLKNIPKGAD